MAGRLVAHVARVPECAIGKTLAQQLVTLSALVIRRLESWLVNIPSVAMKTLRAGKRCREIKLKKVCKIDDTNLSVGLAIARSSAV